MRSFNLIIAIAGLGLLSTCNRVVFNVADEPLLLQHLEALKKVNLEIAKENHRHLSQIKSKVLSSKLYGNSFGHVSNFAKSLIAIDSASRTLISYMDSVETVYAKKLNSGALTIRPSMDPNLGSLLKNKLNAFPKCANR